MLPKFMFGKLKKILSSHPFYVIVHKYLVQQTSYTGYTNLWIHIKLHIE